MSNAKKNEKVRQMIRRTIRVLDLHPDNPSVLLVKLGSELASFDKIKQLAEAMHHAGVNGVVCVVDDFDDLKALDVEAMNHHGWYYAPTQDQEEVQGELPLNL